MSEHYIASVQTDITRRAALAAILLLVGLPQPIARTQDTVSPPDIVRFTAEVRKRVMSDRALQSQYTYLEHRQEVDISRFGKVSTGPLKVYEVYPSVEFGNNYKRLIAVNGVPLSTVAIEKQDRDAPR